MKLPISAIVLTFNEEKNIEDCLKSVSGLVQDVYVVDSFSTDKTLEIIKKYTDKVVQHPFVNYSVQRNWALENLPITTDWVLNLDADHRVEETLRLELLKVFSTQIPQEINGFLLTRKMIFMGRWMKHGGLYPTYHNVLFRKKYGKCEDRMYDQHFVVNGRVEKLVGAIVNVVTDSLTRFTSRHNRWATLEAVEQMSGGGGEINAGITGNGIERRRAFKIFYNRFPLFVRPLVYFFYRYFVKLGFLDGIEGLIYHLLQGFWFRFLVDAKIYEIRRNVALDGKSINEVLAGLGEPSDAQ